MARKKMLVLQVLFFTLVAAGLSIATTTITNTNIDVTGGSINTTDWSNVTITESQISDLQAYLTTESDSLWESNYTAYNDTWTSTTNTSYYLTTNPYNYYNSTDFSIADYTNTSNMNTAIVAANTSMKAYVDSEVATAGGYPGDVFVNESGDTMTGNLTFTSDPDVGMVIPGGSYLFFNSGDDWLFYDTEGSPNDFLFSTNLAVVGYVWGTNIRASGNLTSYQDIFTTGANDDFWLGTDNQNAALFRAYADGSLYVVAINSSNWDNVTITESQISDLGAYLTSYTETDPLWESNYTACDSNSKLYFSGGSLACAPDLTGSGAGTNYWEVSGEWMHENSTAGGKPNLNITAINASDWSNVTITESQISDLQTYLTTESDSLWEQNYTAYNSTWSSITNTSYYLYSNPYSYYNDTDFSIADYYLLSNPYGYYNSTDFSISDYYTSAQIDSFSYYNSSDFDIADYSTTSDMNTAIGAANTSMKDYVDGQGFLTSYTETDPLWTANQSSYLNESDSYDSFYSNIANFTGTLTSSKLCRWDGSEIDCDYTDQVGAGGGGTTYWEIVGSLLSVNTTATSGVDDVNISGYLVVDEYINTSDWSNVTITESQISDFGTYLESYIETDPLWEQNYTTYNSTWSSITNTSYYLYSNPYGYYNDTDFSIANYWTGATIEGYGYYNSSDFDIADYYTTANTFGYYNDTDFSIADYYLLSNPYGYYNDTNFDIADYWTGSTIEGYGYYNSTDFDIADYSTTSDMNTAIGAANTSMKAYVDALDTATNTSMKDYVDGQGFLTSYTESDPLWEANFTSGLNANWDVGAYNITANGYLLNDNEGLYLGSTPADDGRVYFNGTCIRMEVSTTVLAICP